MKNLWLSYQERFLSITLREQILLLLTGVVAVVFVLHTLLIEENEQRITTFEKDIKRLTSTIAAKQQTIAVFEQALTQDPNEKTMRDIQEYERNLQDIDIALLTLTSDLIDPIQMRYALMELLVLQKGVKLVEFNVIAAEPILLANSSGAELAEQAKGVDKSATNVNESNVEEPSTLTLYKHGLKFKLSGRYFQLRDYLRKLEQLQYRFFWQRFDYQLSDYPLSEVEIQLYSLSTKREFIGV